MTTAVQTLAIKARTHPHHHFQNLSGLLDEQLLRESWGQLNKSASAGIDNIDAKAYADNLYPNIASLGKRLKEGRYRANTIKRVYIPKANGKQRPLGLPTIEDKIVQQSVSQILQSIWEQDFLPNSYGYRPSKSAHGAVQSLCVNLQYKGYGYIVEADIKGFFDNMNHQWLMEMLAQRVDDKRLLKLIGQWLKASVQEPDGKINKSSQGTPQGGVISPVLANIYLHYVIDIWFERVVKPRLNGRAMLIRYADDFVVAFQYQNDAKRFYQVLPKRLNKFGLDIAPEKTQLKRFSRFHPGKQRQFQFLGFSFYWSKDRKGEARLRRRTAKSKQREALKSISRWIKLNRHQKLSELMRSLKRRLQGFSNYFGLPDNSRSITSYYNHVIRDLFKWLNRRSQRKSCNWDQYKQMLNWYMIKPLRVRSLTNLKLDWY